MTGAIVLAGGASRRMGADKALIDWNGEPMLLHVIRVVASVVDRVIVASGTADRYPWPSIEQVADAVTDAGPLAGLLAGLNALGEGRHLVVAGDMPAIRPELIRLLLERAADPFDATVPVAAGERQPLCAVYEFRCGDVIAAYLNDGLRSVNGLLGRLTVDWVDEAIVRTADPDLRSFMNLNRPDDLAAIRSEGSMPAFTHSDEQGGARMVDVSTKADTERVAVARGFVSLSPETVRLLRDSAVPKGDALGVARIAGIMAAKRASDLIPLCHPLPITSARVDLEVVDSGVEIEAEISVTGKTGVEMEALSAVSIAALTLYDMVKSVDRTAVITNIRLESKSGGKSGTFTRSR